MSRSAAPTLAALAAICFWSMTPVFVTIIGDRLNSGEIFVLAAIAGGAVSLVVALIDGPLRRTIFSAAVRRFMVPAAISGAFLGLWYYGFYRALQETRKVEATVVAFTWPMIALIALPLLSRRPLRLGAVRCPLLAIRSRRPALAVRRKRPCPAFSVRHCGIFCNILPHHLQKALWEKVSARFR